MRKFEAMKKLLSLLLCAVLVMGMLPIPALAAEGDSCASTPDCTGTYDADGICMVCGAAAPAAGDGAGDSDNEETCQHSGGTAACKAQAVCELCNAPYGELADHAYGTDADGKCDVCGGDCAHAEYAEGKCTVCGMAEPAQVDENVEAVKALIDALPMVEEVSALSYEEKISLYNGAYMTAGNAYNALTEEQKAEVDAAKLMALGAYFAAPSNL